MFGRRRRSSGKHADDAEPNAGALADVEGHERSTEPPGEPAAPTDRPYGPWDGSEPAPDLPRADLGALRVPVAEGVQLQLNVVEDEVVAATVVEGRNTLQLQAFAAPKSGGLWTEAREELAQELEQAGSPVREDYGSFGVELHSKVPVHQGAQPQPARFVGVDGPRWLLRGVFTGPAGADSEQLPVLEEIFGGIVVVRGDAPMPPRERLVLEVPQQAQQAGSGVGPASPGAAGPHQGPGGAGTN